MGDGVESGILERRLQRVQHTGQHIRAFELQVDSWWGPCSAYEHASLDGTKLAATVASRLPDFLARFHPQRLRDLRLSGYRLSEEAAKVLHRFTGLKRLHVYGAGAGSLPPSCAWMVGQLTALTCLDLMAAEIPADLPAAAAHLPSLAALELSSGAPLPGCRPLSALTNLTCLGLFEEESSESGLQLPAVQAFPQLARFELHAAAMQASCPATCMLLPRMEPAQHAIGASQPYLPHLTPSPLTLHVRLPLCADAVWQPVLFSTSSRTVPRFHPPRAAGSGEG